MPLLRPFAEQRNPVPLTDDTAGRLARGSVPDHAHVQETTNPRGQRDHWYNARGDHYPRRFIPIIDSPQARHGDFVARPSGM
jgi:hypothetical protein